MIVEAKDLGEGIRMLTLNHPPANAISRALNEELGRACHGARDDRTVRAVIVTGAGRFFSGGLELKEVLSGQSRIADLAGSEDDGIFALWTLPKPTVAMVNGHAIAGGAILALACDFRITARGSHRIGLNEAAIGLALPIGAFEIVQRALTNRGMRFAALGAGLHEPERALELGFVDEVIAPEKLQSRCVEMAGALARHGRLAYAHTKRAIWREAVARALSQKPEEIREIDDISRSEETRALMAEQVSRLSKR
ncbi:MAG: enoyl-CoA hydratase/isomerase family protein [Candidatus Binataceae bacterium]